MSCAAAVISRCRDLNLKVDISLLQHTSRRYSVCQGLSCLAAACNESSKRHACLYDQTVFCKCPASLSACLLQVQMQVAQAAHSRLRTASSEGAIIFMSACPSLPPMASCWLQMQVAEGEAHQAEADAAQVQQSALLLQKALMASAESELHRHDAAAATVAIKMLQAEAAAVNIAAMQAKAEVRSTVL